jgi:hypothetical protein
MDLLLHRIFSPRSRFLPCSEGIACGTLFLLAGVFAGTSADSLAWKEGQRTEHNNGCGSVALRIDRHVAVGSAPGEWFRSREATPPVFQCC